MFTKYEELLLSSRKAPFQAVQGGFLINYGGSDHFASSIHPLYDRHIDFVRKIDDCERLSIQLETDPCFRIVLSKDYQALDDELFRRGYERIEQGFVERIDIKKIQDELFTFASFIQNGVFVEDELKDFWVTEHANFRGFDKEQERSFVESMRNILYSTAYFTLVEQNTFLGQGIAVFQSDKIFVHTLVINPKYRNLSYGRRLLMSMLSFGLKNGASEAVVELDSKNVPAMKLLSKVGFEELYPYYYRQKNRVKIKRTL